MVQPGSSEGNRARVQVVDPTKVRVCSARQAFPAVAAIDGFQDAFPAQRQARAAHDLAEISFARPRLPAALSY